MNKETMTSHQQLTNLLQLSEQQKAHLTQQLSRYQGWAEVLVHPFYNEPPLDDFSKFPQLDPELGVYYQQARHRAINALSNQQHLPTIIFMDRRESDMELVDKYLPPCGSASPVYYIPTAPHEPVPTNNEEFYSLQKEKSSFFQMDQQVGFQPTAEAWVALATVFPSMAWAILSETKLKGELNLNDYGGYLLREKIQGEISQLEQQAWHELFIQLKEVGLKGTILKGRNYLELANYRGVSPYPIMCVATVAHAFKKRGIAVKFSKATFPMHASPVIRDRFKP